MGRGGSKHRNSKDKKLEKKIIVKSLSSTRVTGESIGLPSIAGRGYACMGFHMVDLNGGICKRNHLPSLIQLVPPTTVVGVGHFVYLFSGMKSSIVDSDELKQLQIQSPKSPWEFFLGGSRLDLSLDQSYMKVWSPAQVPVKGDRHPSCTSLLGKIYSFGSWYLEPEVLDPNVGHWNPVPLRPHLVGCEPSIHAVPDYSNDRILVHLSGGQLPSPTVYAFCPLDQSWTIIASDFSDDDWILVAAVDDGIIYFHSHKYSSVLCAFDIASKSWLTVTWSSSFDNGVDMNNKRMKFDALLPLRKGVLCLAVWTRVFASDGFKTLNQYESKIYFPKFRVQRKCGDDATVHLIPISSHSFVLPATCEVSFFAAV